MNDSKYNYYKQQTWLKNDDLKFLAGVDSIHDFNDSRIQNNENPDWMKEHTLKYLVLNLYKLSGDSIPGGKQDFNSLLSSWLKTSFKKNKSVTPSKVEEQTIDYLEQVYSDELYNNKRLQITYRTIINDFKRIKSHTGLTSNQEILKKVMESYKNYNILEINVDSKSGESIYWNSFSEVERKHIGIFILNFYMLNASGEANLNYITPSYLSFDAGATVLTKRVFTGMSQVKNLVTPLNLADSATVQTQLLVGKEKDAYKSVKGPGDKFVYYFPNHDKNRYNYTSNVMTYPNTNLWLTPNINIDDYNHENRYQFTLNVQNKNIKQPTTVNFDSGGSGPSVTYLATLVSNDYATGQDKINYANPVSGTDVKSIKDSPVTSQKDLYSVLIDLKRTGDWEQCNACHHANTTKYKTRCIMSTLDRLCAFYSRVIRQNTIYNQADNLKLFRFAQNLSPEELRAAQVEDIKSKMKTNIENIETINIPFMNYFDKIKQRYVKMTTSTDNDVGTLANSPTKGKTKQIDELINEIAETLYVQTYNELKKDYEEFIRLRDIMKTINTIINSKIVIKKPNDLNSEIINSDFKKWNNDSNRSILNYCYNLKETTQEAQKYLTDFYNTYFSKDYKYTLSILTNYTSRFTSIVGINISLNLTDKFIKGRGETIPAIEFGSYSFIEMESLKQNLVNLKTFMPDGRRNTDKNIFVDVLNENFFKTIKKISESIKIEIETIENKPIEEIKIDKIIEEIPEEISEEIPEEPELPPPLQKTSDSVIPPPPPQKAISDKELDDQESKTTDAILQFDLREDKDNAINVATNYRNLALLYRKKGDYDNTIKYYKEALKIRRKWLGKKDPKVISSYKNLGMFYEYKGDYETAQKYYKKAMDMTKQSKQSKQNLSKGVLKMLEENQKTYSTIINAQRPMRSNTNRLNRAVSRYFSRTRSQGGGGSKADLKQKLMDVYEYYNGRVENKSFVEEYGGDMVKFNTYVQEDLQKILYDTNEQSGGAPDSDIKLIDNIDQNIVDENVGLLDFQIFSNFFTKGANIIGDYIDSKKDDDKCLKDFEKTINSINISECTDDFKFLLRNNLKHIYDFLPILYVRVFIYMKIIEYIQFKVNIDGFTWNYTIEPTRNKLKKEQTQGKSKITYLTLPQIKKDILDNIDKYVKLKIDEGNRESEVKAAFTDELLYELIDKFISKDINFAKDLFVDKYNDFNTYIDLSYTQGIYITGLSKGLYDLMTSLVCITGLLTIFDFYKVDQIQYSDIRSVDNDEEFVKTLYEIYLTNGLSSDITESSVIIEMSRMFINTLGSTQTIISDLRETLTSDIDFETLIAQIYVFYNDIHIGYLTSLFPIKKDESKSCFITEDTTIQIEEQIEKIVQPETPVPTPTVIPASVSDEKTDNERRYQEAQEVLTKAMEEEIKSQIKETTLLDRKYDSNIFKNFYTENGQGIRKPITNIYETLVTNKGFKLFLMKNMEYSEGLKFLFRNSFIHIYLLIKHILKGSTNIPREGYSQFIQGGRSTENNNIVEETLINLIS